MNIEDHLHYVEINIRDRKIRLLDKSHRVIASQKYINNSPWGLVIQGLVKGLIWRKQDDGD